MLLYHIAQQTTLPKPHDSAPLHSTPTPQHATNHPHQARPHHTTLHHVTPYHTTSHHSTLHHIHAIAAHRKACPHHGARIDAFDPEVEHEDQGEDGYPLVVVGAADAAGDVGGDDGRECGREKARRRPLRHLIVATVTLLILVQWYTSYVIVHQSHGILRISLSTHITTVVVT